jgi:hypothetical protein
VTNVHVFKKDKASAGIQIPEKDSGKGIAKTTGVPSRTIRRVFIKRVFKEIPSTPVYTPDKNRC